jgi:transcription initiation factor TFIIIB Brf1 subunit/transcription initiation factor TFIIB
MKNSNSHTRTPYERVSDFALRIMKKLACDEAVWEEAISLLERADKEGFLTQGMPKGLAAGIVYIACILNEDRMTLDTIGGAIGVSGSTVSKSYMTIAWGLGFSER